MKRENVRHFYAFDFFHRYIKSRADQKVDQLISQALLIPKTRITCFDFQRKFESILNVNEKKSERYEKLDSNRFKFFEKNEFEAGILFASNLLFEIVLLRTLNFGGLVN